MNEEKNNKQIESFDVCMKCQNDENDNLANKRFIILAAIIFLCFIEGLSFFDIFSYKLTQNSNDWFSYFSYSLLYLITFILLSIPSFFLIETNIGIALILSCLCSIAREVFYILFMNYFFICKEISVFLSCIAMILLFNSLGKIIHLWFPYNQTIFFITFCLFFIFFGGSISFFINEIKNNDNLLYIFSIIKIVLSIICSGILHNPLPKVYNNYKTKQKNLYLPSKINQLKKCFANFNQIFILSIIMSSHLFLFLSYYDGKGNIIRIDSSYIGIVFVTFIIGTIIISIYFYLSIIYNYLIIGHLIISFISILLSVIFFYSEFFPFQSYLKNILFIILHIIFGINVSIFIFISYDYLIELNYPLVGESVTICLYEIITCFITLLLVLIDYFLREFFFNSGEIYIELVIYLIPLISGGILYFINIDNFQERKLKTL